jgi:hypothetical protein
MLAGFDEYPAGRSGIETRADGPGQDLSREIVDDGVDVRLGAVEQLYDRDVDVPKFVGASGANADGGLDRVDAKARAAPAAVVNEPSPRARRGEDPADALGVRLKVRRGMWRYSGARTMSLTMATSAAVSWPGTVRGHGERSSRPQTTATRRQAW